MSGLNRLRELAALLQPPIQPVAEESKLVTAFDGLKSVVTDAMDDLNDKLGEGGALETLLDKAKLSDKDTVKDKDGATILERLSIRTKQYRKEVDNLLMEVELMLASAPLAEAKAIKVKEPGWYVVDQVDTPLEGPMSERGARRRADELNDENTGPRGDIRQYDISYWSDFDIKRQLKEMASSNAYRGGGGSFGRKEARLMVKAFKANEESFDLPNGNSYEADKPTNGGALKKGDVVFAAHDSTNTGAELYEVLGFGPADTVKFDDMKAVYKATGVKTMKALEAWNRANKDDEVRLIVKDLEDGSSGGWFYVSEGRWCYGSGAEPLSFTAVKKV